MSNTNSPFFTITQRVIYTDESSTALLNLSGVDATQWVVILSEILTTDKLKEKSLVLIAKDNQQAESLLQLTEDLFCIPSYTYLGDEFTPYNTILSSENNLLLRINTILNIFNNSNSFIIITTLESLALKIPHPQEFQELNFKIEVSDIIDPYQLANKLENLGYQNSISVEEPGSFTHKGEIFDIFPVGGEPLRLHYFDDMIEHIYKIDPNSYKTLRENELEQIKINPTAKFILQEQYIANFHQALNTTTSPTRNITDRKRLLLNHLRQGQLFEDYPKFFSLFFKNQTTLFNILNEDNNLLFNLLDAEQSICDLENFFDLAKEEFQLAQEQDNIISLLPKPELLYDLAILEKIKKQKIITTNSISVSQQIEDDFYNVHIGLSDLKNFLATPHLAQEQLIEKVLCKIKKEFAHNGHILLYTKHQSTKEKIKYLLEQKEFPANIRERFLYRHGDIKKSFFHQSSNTLALSEAELFKRQQKKKTKHLEANQDLFAEQLSTLKAGDFVIHRDYGIARYLGMELVKLGEVTSDFLILEFQQQDKIYLPVYKVNLIQKQGGAETELKVASLRNNKFQQIKNKARDSAKKLAFDLLRLQAERANAKAFAFSPPGELYENFAQEFSFTLTPDQERTIELVLEDMQQDKPMDHLVCGDVGFGKTEVAMRAAFKAVEDNKQVVILVPTTVLALQHYNSFLTRFKNFPIEIEFLSRFKTTKESKEIKEKLSRGEIDIIIGTHRLLSKDITYKDLGLVIVDEEHRFGVGHKEKLKLLKKSVDFLTLTATPIPRTLQFSMLGIRDLSLIKTPPPKRQSIKSYLIIDDDITIKKAIERELNRGGQVFIVHNRVSDIEEYTRRIRSLVPNAEIIFAHGQMNEKELEQRISAFYQGKYQILVSTTIIESGIDIPNANTMIINRADRFGLAQLHQLRGRIGRSDKKAYAYFIIPAHNQLTEIANQRLKALQTYSEMGSGFNIATVDLELRGAGDLLGAEQSGHLTSVGLELYMELLEETIREIKGEQKIVANDIEIQTSFSSFIPQTYINDPSERLKYYKKLSNSKTLEEITETINLLIDIFGPIPEELQELEAIIRTRIVLRPTAISKVKVVGKMITLEFSTTQINQNEELKSRIINYFLAHPKKYRFTPNNGVIYQHPSIVDSEALINFAHMLNREISE